MPDYHLAQHLATLLADTAKGHAAGRYPGLSLEEAQAALLLREVRKSDGEPPRYMDPGARPDATLLIAMLLLRLGGSVVLGPEEIAAAAGCSVQSEQGRDTYALRVLR